MSMTASRGGSPASFTRRHGPSLGATWFHAPKATAATLAILGVAACDTIEPEGIYDEDYLDTTAVAARTAISDPVDAPDAEAIGVSSRYAASLGSSFVYVSLMPGTLESGSGVAVGNGSIDDQVIPVVDGGFDPIAIPASAGDVLVFSVREGTFELATWSETVPMSSPPSVVRSSPARGKRDVPVALSIVVVFSEPMDSTSLAPLNVRLNRGSQDVPGRIDLSPDLLSMTFTPDAALEGGADHVLTVGLESSDLDGESLGTDQQIEFTTTLLPTIPGSTIAFTRNGRLVLMDLDGGTLQELTSGPSFDDEAAWSPDGTRLAFTRYRPESGHPNWGEAAIYVINADGSGFLRLSGQGSAVYDAHPTWSADGSRIVFYSRRDADAGDAFHANDSEIYVMNADGSNPVRLTSLRTLVFNPAWSPDGSRIAFRGWNSTASTWSIFVMTADGSNPTAVANGESAYSPSWSPDGERLLTRTVSCLSWQPAPGGPDCLGWDGPHLVSIAPDGSNPTRVADFTLNAYDRMLSPDAWSPDGQYIAVSHSGCRYGTTYCALPNYVDLLRLSDGLVVRLAEGSSPAWRP